MATKWYHNAKTGEVDNYTVEGTLTDFPRGVLMAYGDYLTTGFESKAEAKEWAESYGHCPKCRSVRRKNEKGKCLHCGGDLVFHKSLNN